MHLYAVLAVLALLLLLLYIIFDWLWPYSVPTGGRRLPGPLGVPLLGYMPFMSRAEPYKVFAELGERYGQVFQVRLGIRTVVVLDSHEAWKLAYAKDPLFAGRPQVPSFRTFAESGGGGDRSRFAMRDGDAQWRFLRKTAVRALTLFSTSRNSRLDAIVDGDAHRLVEKIRAKAGKPFSPHRDIFNCVASVIGSINFGGDYDTDDPLLRNVIHLTEVVAKFITVGSALDFLPFGELFQRKRIDEFLRGISPINELTERCILEVRVEDVEHNDQVRTVADALYRTALETPEHEKRALRVDNDHIRFISQDLFGAGFATTMESLRWAVNFLAKYDRAQAAAQRELDDVLKGEPVALKHVNALPYLNGVLLESLRLSSLVPLSLPHSTMAATTLLGYHIPAGAIVFANVYKHHRNERYFSGANDFRPERYFKGNGEIDVELASYVLPFGVGKRRCVGENVARQELFILIGRLLQSFTWRPAPGVHIDPDECGVGFTRRPMDYELVFDERHAL